VRDMGRTGGLDQHAVEAVLVAAGHRAANVRRAWPSGLTDREIDVLRLIARGHTLKDVAQELTITRKTAEHHVQHIYTKIGCSTRGAAALFAIRHGI
jgi:DNA-binding NarL/FixJ family response regulator